MTEEQITNLLPVLIPIVAPLIMAGVKQIFSRVPKWSIPYLMPVIGAGLDVVAYQTGLIAEANPALGALLGAGGTWIREAVDQATKRVRAGGKSTSSTAPRPPTPGPTIPLGGA